MTSTMMLASDQRVCTAAIG